jgi:hypothetical protein
MVLRLSAEADGTSAAESKRSMVAARDTGLVEYVDGMAEGWAEATQGVKWLGVCAAQRTQTSGSIGWLQEEGCQHSSSRASAVTVKEWRRCNWWLRTFVRGLPAARTSVTVELTASGDSLPETSRVVQHSFACPKSLVSVLRGRWMRGCWKPCGAKQQWMSM